MTLEIHSLRDSGLFGNRFLRCRARHTPVIIFPKCGARLREDAVYLRQIPERVIPLFQLERRYTRALRPRPSTVRRLKYPLMRPLTPAQLLDYTEGGPRSCEPRYCDLWLLSANIDIAEREILERPLSADERARAGRFRFEEDRVRFIVARGGLRRILSSYCSDSPHHLEFQPGSHGKLALLGPPAGIEFNVSHSGDYALISVTSGVPCGVDLEHSRANMEEVAIAERFFCPREVEWLAHTERGFLRLWVVKEAIIKAVGHGLSIPLSDVDVTDVVEGKTSRVTLRTSAMEPQTLWLNELPFVPNCAAAVATVKEKCIIRPVADHT